MAVTGVLDERLDVVALHRSFPGPRGSLKVLDGLSFTVRKGEFVSVIGPSGCGKSTLFNILAGLEIPDRGGIDADGRSVIADTSLCAYMPQKDLLLPWRSILDNACLGLEIQGTKKREARARVRDLLPTFGLHGFEEAYPFELSGGMRQRVALLRTVVQGRPILLLDEPFGALDYLTRTELQLWLADMWQRERWTVVLITHDVPEAVFLSDRVVALSQRPARADLIVDIDLPRPRDVSCHSSAHFAELEGILLNQLRSSLLAATSTGVST